MRERDVMARLSRRLPLVVLLGMLGVLPLAVSGATAQKADPEGLKTAVVAEMPGLDEAKTSSGDPRTQVNVRRRTGDWAFGTAVIEAPEEEGAYPEGWLFVARETAGGWDVGLEGDREFADLIGEVPGAMMDDEERDLLAPSGETDESEAQRVLTGMRLPWKLGRSWTMTSGPHGFSTGYDQPYSSLDLAGGNGRVRAARGGIAYTMCASGRGWIRVVHGGGFSTDYYHLARNIRPRDGKKRIASGTLLGYTGTNTSCGGAATGPHVHFSLRRYGSYASLNGKTIGGWTFRKGDAYGGYATHKGAHRRPGDQLYNYG